MQYKLVDCYENNNETICTAFDRHMIVKAAKKRYTDTDGECALMIYKRVKRGWVPCYDFDYSID